MEAGSSAYSGTARCGENLRSSLWPMIIPSRAYEWLSRPRRVLHADRAGRERDQHHALHQPRTGLPEGV
ncbi:hypothetical protein L1I79_34405 [Strepomyces sp. STD 3.1]|nr:hypothetical protein [Streptomyces sp. STD 3.1]